MKLMTFETDGACRIGVLRSDVVFDVRACRELCSSASVPDGILRDMRSLLAAGDAALVAVSQCVSRAEGMLKEPAPPVAFPVDGVRLSAPVPRPGKFLTLAGNYAEHIQEGGREAPGKERMTPRVFMKPVTAVVGPNDAIVIPRNGNQIDWEAELGVVIGRTARFVEPEEALDCVAGYTVVNDVSERSLRIDVEREPNEWNGFFDWLNGKWFDTFGPMGPCIATCDEIPNPQGLRITLRLNGETKQDANTGQMIFNVAEIVSWCSRLMTLEPGDVIATGTPSGVGAASGTFLKDGDLVEAAIEGIGALRNGVCAE